MFSKVIISDDFDSVNKSVLSIVNELKVKEVEQVQYCDDAYLKVKKALLDNNPFQLLVTDLSYKADHREQKFQSGEELIKALKQSDSSLKIIVYSVEDRPLKIRKLVQELNIDGYVNKGRRGLVELQDAIRKVAKNEKYVSPHLEGILKSNNKIEFTEYDSQLMGLLSKGYSQEEISAFFVEKNITPSSLSSIEKKLNKLKTEFKANNAVHLVSIVKDLGLI
ncbi:response regulator [Aureisphaera sp. CAU 1614]|uniref:Response regulator n=1 Tax=Halomarinibacterium sedimenti TaxID=2857106 RepID=A0A9X1FN88_9FLAO|nr:response regulator [Halomarinibacterium sedimenti]MBW2937552.1 response regulator [Halomarinibacterium sedimenti]